MDDNKSLLVDPFGTGIASGMETLYDEFLYDEYTPEQYQEVLDERIREKKEKKEQCPEMDPCDIKPNSEDSEDSEDSEEPIGIENLHYKNARPMNNVFSCYHPNAYGWHPPLDEKSFYADPLTNDYPSLSDGFLGPRPKNDQERLDQIVREVDDMIQNDHKEMWDNEDCACEIFDRAIKADIPVIREVSAIEDKETDKMKLRTAADKCQRAYQYAYESVVDSEHIEDMFYDWDDDTATIRYGTAAFNLWEKFFRDKEIHSDGTDVTYTNALSIYETMKAKFRGWVDIVLGPIPDEIIKEMDIRRWKLYQHRQALRSSFSPDKQRAGYIKRLEDMSLEEITYVQGPRLNWHDYKEIVKRFEHNSRK